MTDTLNRVGGGNDRVRADVAAGEIPVVLGELTVIDVEVTNVSEVIRSYHVDVLGLDADYVQVDGQDLDLFPSERRGVKVAFRLPETYPSGRRRVAIEITEPGLLDDSPVVVELDLVLDPQDALSLVVEPATLETGRDGSYLLTVVNTGNTTIDVEPSGKDPERIVQLSFDPPRHRLVPGERTLIRVTAEGERPWFGMPAVRIIDLSVTAGTATALSTVALLQRPRISRRLLSLLGLLFAVSVFAFVIWLSFRDVAALSAANENLIKQGLGEDQPVGMRAEPNVVGGTVASTTGGGIDGVAVELYEAANPLLPALTTVTDTAGAYRFGSVPDGEYLLRVQVAGFGESWFPNAETVSDAEVLAVPGSDLDGLDIVLAGQPGSVAGNVIGEDVEGALVVAQIPAEVFADSELDEADNIAAVVQSVEVDATGAFVLEGLPTPADYQLLVTKAGFAPALSDLNLRPGEQRDGIDVLLRRGDGRITGTVVDTAGTLLPGVVILATDGSASSETRTLSEDGRLGTFELRDLPTPATYTLSVSAPGFFDETVTVPLAEEGGDEVSIVMTSAQGSLSGTVRDAAGDPLGGVSVTVDGPDIERTTRSVSVGEVGAWQVSGLPVPGTYTVTFEREGLTPQARSIELTAGAEADRGQVDARLVRSTGSLNGSVVDPAGTRLPGVDVVLESSDLTRSTITANTPLGTFGFTDVPPGAYTLTFRRTGSTPQTLLIDLAAGQDRTLEPIGLERQARIEGVVRRLGVGEAGIGVVVYSLEGFPTESRSTTVTGAGGRFELLGLEAPESYIIEFRVPAGGLVVASETVFLRAGEELILPPVDLD